MTIDTAAPAFDRRFRDVLGSFCSGVTVITSMRDGSPVGLTCQSFFSVSIAPPLVAFSIAKTSSTFPLIRMASTCCVNVLAADQEATSRSFGRTGVDKWSGVAWHPSRGEGHPVLDDVLAWLEVRIEVEYDAGDHVLVVAEILDMALEREADPLLFFRGRYAQLAPAPSTPTTPAEEER